MNNHIIYRFEDFTISNYKSLLQKAKELGFHFVNITELSLFPKSLFLRHDVEFSPFIALKMALIEAELDIKSTYFFQLHGELYNVVEKDISAIVKNIKALGHEIGLHFDSHYFDIKDEAELDKYLEIDKRYFNAIFETDIKAFSFHNTNSFILSCEKETYANLINVYSKKIKESCTYCSDSTGYWRFEKLTDVLENPDVKKLHLLIHDAMWSERILSPRQRVFKAIDDNGERIKKWYDKTLKDFGAKNIDFNEIL